MGKEKRLTIALAFCGLSLCIAVGALAHVYQESREQGECLTAAQRQIEVLETQLSQVTKETAQMEEQLALAEAEKAEAEKERDNAQRQYEWATKRDNPIDRYYYSDKRERGSTTFEMGVDASFYCEAWKHELVHAVEWVKGMSEYEEDHRLLENYQMLVQTQAHMAYDILLMRGAGDYKPEERGENRQYILGTYGSVGATQSSAEVYRQGAIWLIDTYGYVVDWHYMGYDFAFNDFISEWREECGEEWEQAFPPISQVLPD